MFASKKNRNNMYFSGNKYNSNLFLTINTRFNRQSCHLEIEKKEDIQ